MEELDEFRYLGSYIGKVVTIEKEITLRLCAAAEEFKAGVPNLYMPTGASAIFSICRRRQCPNLR